MHPTSAAALDDRASALAALGPNREKRLAVYASLARRGLDDDADDLLQGAYLRWMGSDVPVVGPDETYDFLIGAMNSLRSNAFRRKRLTKRVLGERAQPVADDEEDPIDAAPANGTSPEDCVFARQLYDHLGGDPDLQLLVLHISERTSRVEIKRDLGWDDKKYDAVQKRKIRAAAKLIGEGKV